MVAQALEGIKVLDLSQCVSGPYCTKLLGAFGAEVIKVEKPNEGDISRRLGPFPGDKPHPERSGLFLYLNTSKKSVTLSVKTRTGIKILKELVKAADVLVENFEPGVMASLGLDYEALEKINPRLVMTSVTDFGQAGPYRNYKSASIVNYALSGHMYVNGAPDREPLQGAGLQPEYQGGLHGFLGTIAALYYREEAGQGQYVDVSIQEAMAGFHQSNVTDYTYIGQIKHRPGNRSDSRPYAAIYPCKDGYITLCAPTQLQEEALYTLIGKPEMKDDPRFRSSEDIIKNADAWDALVRPWFKTRTKEEIFHTCAEWRIPAAPVSNPEDIINDPHFQARGFWVELEHPEVGSLIYPGAPFKMSATPGRAVRAPLLGEHNEEIYCGRLGYSREDMGKLRQTGII